MTLTKITHCPICNKKLEWANIGEYACETHHDHYYFTNEFSTHFLYKGWFANDFNIGEEITLYSSTDDIFKLKYADLSYKENLDKIIKLIDKYSVLL